MFETLSILPVSFWVVILLLLGGAVWSFQHLSGGTGLPLLAVLGTTAAWYVGDAIYNDYAHNHRLLFSSAILDGAWWEVAWFLVVLLVSVPVVHRLINARYLNRRSGVLTLFAHGVNQPIIQRQLNLMFGTCATVWIILLVIAALVLKGQVIYFLFPFLGYKPNPWGHGQIGAGFDCFSIVALYLQLLTATMFGVVAALAMNRGVRRAAIVLCLLAWPWFVFDRVRNLILALVIPTVLSWVFLRFRGQLWKKVLILSLLFCVFNVWMKFVIANRSHESIVQAFSQKGLDLAETKNAHNEGLNMYEELCWINDFIDKGTYRVNWGARYFAELVNPIPRALWPGKPLIGLDYAVARGHKMNEVTHTVDTTIATGMIGQGVVNFGRLLGPAAAAVLMSLWVAWLARLDLNVHALGRLPLYAMGLILTFNLGRDITLITLYPFVFGSLAVWWLDRNQPSRPNPSRRRMNRSNSPAGLPPKASGQAWAGYRPPFRPNEARPIRPAPPRRPPNGGPGFSSQRPWPRGRTPK